MAEFLIRGYNTAIPDVDLGDDIFVVRDRDGALSRVQVKTTMLVPRRDEAVGQFRVSYKHLETRRAPDITFVFAGRAATGWATFTLVPRAELLDAVTQGLVGRTVQSAQGASVLFRFVYGGAPLAAQRCGALDLRPWADNWSRWPNIR